MTQANSQPAEPQYRPLKLVTNFSEFGLSVQLSIHITQETQGRVEALLEPIEYFRSLQNLPFEHIYHILEEDHNWMLVLYDPNNHYAEISNNAADELSKTDIRLTLVSLIMLMSLTKQQRSIVLAELERMYNELKWIASSLIALFVERSATTARAQLALNEVLALEVYRQLAPRLMELIGVK